MKGSHKTQTCMPLKPVTIRDCGGVVQFYAATTGTSTARTNGGGQLLICVDGEGWYQEEGKPAQSLSVGDVVTIPANVKHWHGAKADSWFSHIAVEVPGEDCRNEWCEPVSDTEYNAL